uniref:protein-tyrosine-phosphatase n=1 Tax=Aceria tosichella TaxID=561515 RepID=A0A6G1SPB9_9ACAR
MISSSDRCRQLVAGNYDVILDDDEIATFKSVLSEFLARFEHHESELISIQQQQPAAAAPLMAGSYFEEFKMLKELSKALKENTDNFIDGLEFYNQPKNRYKDIIPFNHTRVILNNIPELEPGSNYINANYVRGPSGSQRSYIACQGPLPHTLNDFWRMIWECRVSVIVMACNEQEMGKSKCEQYWPNQVSGSIVYGNIQVTLMRVRQINSDFLIRKFLVQLLGPEERVEEDGHDDGDEPMIARPAQAASANESAPSQLNEKVQHSMATTDHTYHHHHHQHYQQANTNHDNNNNHNHINSTPMTIPTPIPATTTAATTAFTTTTTTNNANLNGNHYHQQNSNDTCGFSNSGNSSTSNESINMSDDSTSVTTANKNLASSQHHPNHHHLHHHHNNHHQNHISHQNNPNQHIQDQRYQSSNKPNRIGTGFGASGGGPRSKRPVLMERTVCQFHFQGWQDHGVPDSVQSILALVRLIREVQPGYSSSILVHCSAGCGRTGTICCIDYVYGLMRMGRLRPDFDLFSIISEMRQQRMAMVQTIEQYILCHRAVAALFMQQLHILGFGLNRGRCVVAIEKANAAESTTGAGLDGSEQVDEEADKSNHYDTSSSTVATDEQSSNSKCSFEQFDEDNVLCEGQKEDQEEATAREGEVTGNNGDEEDQDLGPVFI